MDVGGGSAAAATESEALDSEVLQPRTRRCKQVALNFVFCFLVSSAILHLYVYVYSYSQG